MMSARRCWSLHSPNSVVPQTSHAAPLRARAPAESVLRLVARAKERETATQGAAF